MATIQIRDIPEDAHETLPRRARGEGRSIQSYVREQVLVLATRPTEAELVRRIEEGPAGRDGLDVPPQALADDVGADRRWAARHWSWTRRPWSTR